ncbi:MAG: PAS domain S-box protein [Acidobacteriota bacterium]|nr:PAS domain S-box protein [Acidobacteriota bacterium]
MSKKEILEELFGDTPYKALVGEIKDFAILHLDAQGIILSWNKGAERIFGYTGDEVIGKSGEIIFTPEDRAQNIPEKEFETARTKNRADDTRWHLRKDGSRFFANDVTTALRDGKGTLCGYAKIARDETRSKQAEEMLLERSRLEALNGEIGRALVRVDAPGNLLKQCAEILVKHLDVVLARIWTFNEDENILELQASAGIYTHLDGAHSRIPLGKYKIGLIAEERVPHLTNEVSSDPRVSDKEWAKREGIIAFAGYPLIVENRLVGVMCVFARHRLTETTLAAMSSVSNGIANGIERKRIEDALRQSEEQYRIVAETASDAIISIDEQSIILFINRAATRIFGYEIEQMIGQNLSMLMPEYLRELHAAGQRRYIETGKRHLHWEHVEVPGLHRDGHEFPLELSFGEYNKRGRHVFIGIARDISERKQVEVEREQLLQREQTARAQAEEANRIKDEFLATVSHELRTPLNAILGWSSLLRSGRLDTEASVRALETVERNARAQSQLIDDLLDISRIITGRLRLSVHTIELAAVIESSVEAVRPAAEAKEIRLQTLIDPKAGPISGDADRLQQIFWNLLSNAVKFTQKRGRVQIRLEQINSHVEITVSDTGKGIASEFIPHVFDRFRQADQTTTRRQGGLGLGLSIARQLVEMHGGTIRAESEGEEKGTSFVVKLPRLIAVPRAAKEKEKRVHPTASKEFLSIDCAPELTGLRILIVDDEADARALLRQMLEMCGSKVTTTSSAAEALDRLKSGVFDVLVSDIGMPEEDGYTLIGKVRLLPAEKGGRIPAVALTAYARIEDRVRSLTAGFQVHVPKPVEPVELAAVVASLAKGMGKP